MKKCLYLIIAAVIAILLMNGCAVKQEIPVSWNNNADDFSALSFQAAGLSPQTAQELFSKYLPAVIFENMLDFTEREGDGQNYWFWSARSDNTDRYYYSHAFACHLENGVLRQYHYRNYDFSGIPENNIDMEQAFVLARSFAVEFIQGGENLDFKHELEADFNSWYSRMYNESKVEVWTAQDAVYKYAVAVNLVYGYIEFYIAEPIAVINERNESGSVPVNIEFNVSIQPEQYNENPFGGRIVNEIFRSKEEFEAYCGDEVYAALAENYGDEYFRDNALLAFTFYEYLPSRIAQVIKLDNSLTIRTDEKIYAGGSARVFLIEMNKADAEGVTELYPMQQLPVTAEPPETAFAPEAPQPAAYNILHFIADKYNMYNGNAMIDLNYDTGEFMLHNADNSPVSGIFSESETEIKLEIKFTHYNLFGVGEPYDNENCEFILEKISDSEYIFKSDLIFGNLSNGVIMQKLTKEEYQKIISGDI